HPLRHPRRRERRPDALRGALRPARPPPARLHARARRGRLRPRARQPRCRPPARGRGRRRDHRPLVRVRRPRVHPLRPALLARGPGGHGAAPEPGHRPPPARRVDHVGARARLHASPAQLGGDAHGRAPLLPGERHDADLAQLRPRDRLMAAHYTLYVMSNSPYSDKIRMYLKLKRLPVVEVRENLRNREQVLRARTGRTMVPVVITPADEALNDSTHITRTLEAACPVPALRPADPGRRGLDALLENYADEWVVRVMLGSRWLHEPDAELNRTVIAADMTCGAPEVEVAAAKEMFTQGITATLPPMGATRETLGFLLDDLSGLVTDLDALFAAHRFLGGAEPTVADLAFYGQLNQIRRDPTGRVMVGDPGRAHGRWLAELEAAVAAAGRLVGGATDREIFAELAGLGRLLAPYPTLAHATAV